MLDRTRGGLVGGLNNGERRTASRSQLAALKDFGRSLGLAFQMRDDYLGTFGNPRLTGKSAGNDLRRGKKTFVVLAALETAGNQERTRISKVLGNHKATDEEIRSVVALLKRLRIDESCMKVVREYANLAIVSLEGFDVGREREMLEKLAIFAANRDS